MTHTTERSPLDQYIAKLERRSSLPLAAKTALEALPVQVIVAAARSTVVTEGTRSSASLLLLEGYISRRKVCGEASQIVGIGIPGDAVDLQSLFFHTNDHTLVAQTDVQACLVTHASIIELCEREPAINRALWHDTLVDAAIFREWTLNIGHRPAAQRIGHLLLELHARQKAHDLTDDASLEIPLSQTELASALGLSLVHTNKSLRALREAGLLAIDGRHYRLLQHERLSRMTGFNPAYLHLDRAPKI